jgi:hypothetical protein
MKLGAKEIKREKKGKGKNEKGRKKRRTNRRESAENPMTLDIDYMRGKKKEEKKKGKNVKRV